MTRPTSLPLFIVGLVLTLLASGCAPQAQLREDPEDFREEVARLQREIAENPDDAEAFRDLGAIYVRTKRPSQGYKYLQKAFSRDSSDPKTMFYLGVASERLGRMQTAQQLYQRYPNVPDDSRFRTLMKGRYEWLLRQEVEAQMAQMVHEDSTLTGGNIGDRVVAVLPFSYQGSDEQYAPLGRGLGEMISVDLAQIDELQLVERLRIDALLKELKLSQSEYVDPATAPRAGRILGAGRLVGGAYSVLGEEDLRVETALAEVQQNAASSEIESHSDALEQLFALENEIVFEVAGRLGVELSPQEQAAIERVPTRNLQAFLAYSRGLEHEAQGNYEAAAEAFGRANELDPEFSEAAQKQETAQAMSVGGGEVSQALLSAARLEPAPPTTNLVQSRLRTLTTTVGGGVIGESDTRQPGAEAAEVILEDPPPPPGGGGGHQ